MNAYDSTTRTHKGHTITVSWHYDQDCGEPWKEHDGHGEVSEWTTRDKQPGELVLCSDGRSKRFYNFAAAVRTAKRDGWDAKPYNTGHETKGQQAAKAVMADYEYLRAWYNDEWHWSGYTVEIEGFDYSESLWGIDSPSQKQFEEEAFADAIEWLENELTEREDAECRDVATV